MTVKQLRDLLSGFDDELEVGFASFDEMGNVEDTLAISELVINIDHKLLILK